MSPILIQEGYYEGFAETVLFGTHRGPVYLALIHVETENHFSGFAIVRRQPFIEGKTNTRVEMSSDFSAGPLRGHRFAFSDERLLSWDPPAVRVWHRP